MGLFIFPLAHEAFIQRINLHNEFSQQLDILHASPTTVSILQTRSTINNWSRLSNIEPYSASSLTSSPFFLSAAESKYFWDLPNGKVQFEDPIPFRGIGREAENVENYGQVSYFGDPVFLGRSVLPF